MERSAAVTWSKNHFRRAVACELSVRTHSREIERVTMLSEGYLGAATTGTVSIRCDPLRKTGCRR